MNKSPVPWSVHHVMIMQSYPSTIDWYSLLTRWRAQRLAWTGGWDSMRFSAFRGSYWQRDFEWSQGPS